MTDLCSEEDNRRTLFPIRHSKLWDIYKKHEAAIWTAEEIDLSKDTNDWNKLSNNEKHFIKYVLAFFAESDAIVADNLAERFYNEVKIREARCFYGFQIAMENIHGETYSLLIDTYIKDEKEKHTLLNAINNILLLLLLLGYVLPYHQRHRLYLLVLYAMWLILFPYRLLSFLRHSLVRNTL